MLCTGDDVNGCICPPGVCSASAVCADSFALCLSGAVTVTPLTHRTWPWRAWGSLRGTGRLS
eukprot:1667715-Prymnesium_polylepis.1